jgi:hypothetical protein
VDVIVAMVPAVEGATIEALLSEMPNGRRLAISPSGV